eukprot:4629565-Prymnesium_polylepis.1
MAGWQRGESCRGARVALPPAALSAPLVECASRRGPAAHFPPTFHARAAPSPRAASAVLQVAEKKKRKLNMYKRQEKKEKEEAHSDQR